MRFRAWITSSLPVTQMAGGPQHRLLAQLTRCLAPFFARSYLVVFGLLAVAIVMGVLGLPLVAYFLLCAVVLVVGFLFAGCGLWLALFASALFRRRLKEKEIASAYSGLVIFLA